jgi:uncharacterized membrane protein
VTHLSAPGFFLLMGIGMALFYRSRREHGWTWWAVVRHFLIRGVVLIVLQFLVINRAWELSPGGWGIPIYAGVLFALGGTMILGSTLVSLKPAYLLGLTLVLVVGMELLVPDPGRWGLGMSTVQLLALVPGGLVGDQGLILWSNYPILPWLEMVTFGLALGHWLADDANRAFKRMLIIGAACIPAFLVLRYLDGFGNIRPRLGNGWMDVLNLVKYPPSMTFTLLTTGLDLILLGLIAQAGMWGRRVLRPLIALGRVPLLFYLTHAFLYAGMGHLLAPSGSSIPAMVPFWLLGLLILYPLCLYYGRFKQRQPVRSIVRYL